MHWDGTVSLGNLLSVIVMIGSFLAIYAKLVRMVAIFEEYPPHKHHGNMILYPKGMKPDDPGGNGNGSGNGGKS